MNVSTIRPLGDRVVVEVVDEDVNNSTGIIVPTSKNTQVKEGRVVAVGIGKRNTDGKLIPMNVTVGDKVMFGTYSATELSKGDKTLVMLIEDDIMGVLD